MSVCHAYTRRIKGNNNNHNLDKKTSCMFRDGLSFLIKSMTLIRQSNLLEPLNGMTTRMGAGVVSVDGICC